MRDRMLISAGHALLAMCAFIWVYSMAIALTPDAGRSAPSALLCGVGIFGIAFLVSQARYRVVSRSRAATPRAAVSMERVVLDGSLPLASLSDGPARRQPAIPRKDIVPGEERHPERGNSA